MCIKNIQSSAFQDKIRQLINGGTNVMVNQLGQFLDQNSTNLFLTCFSLPRRNQQIHFARARQAASIPPFETSLHGAGHLRKTRSSSHDGIKETLYCIREKHWVLRGRKAVKRVATICSFTFKKFQGKSFATPKEPSLWP